MLRALFQIVFFVVFLVPLIAFAISNQQTVSLALWPTDVTLEAPLSIAVLIIAGAFFLLGAVMVWIPSLGHRHRARRAEKKVAALHAEIATRDRVTPKVPLLAPPR
jgi:uncharacterized integral membrane protein